MPTAWKDKPSFLTPSYTEHQVGGETYHFYPISLAMGFHIRRFAEPLAQALAVLLTDRDGDLGTTTRHIKEGDGSEVRETLIQPASEALVKLRTAQQAEAFSKLFEALTDNTDTVASIIMDSMRDTFPKDDRPPAKEFLDQVPVPAAVEMIVGVVKANKGAFGPLGGLAEQAIAAARSQVESRMQTPGKSSSEPSSKSSNEATTASGS